MQKPRIIYQDKYTRCKILPAASAQHIIFFLLLRAKPTGWRQQMIRYIRAVILGQISRYARHILRLVVLAGKSGVATSKCTGELASSFNEISTSAKEICILLR